MHEYTHQIAAMLMQDWKEGSLKGTRRSGSSGTSVLAAGALYALVALAALFIAV